MSEENMTMDDLSKAVDESFDTFKDEGEADWDKINQYLTEKTVLTVTVEEVVNKGVVTHLEGIRAFIPASHLALTHVDDLSTYVGKEIQVQVLEADQAAFFFPHAPFSAHRLTNPERKRSIRSKSERF